MKPDASAGRDFMTKAFITEQKLENEGWVFDHSATTRPYKSAGSTEEMKSMHGYEYIRVYTSLCKGKLKYQVSNVYRREIKK